MHTEHLTNVRPVWVVAGWLVAVAATSLIVLVLVSLELMGGETGAPWAVVAVALGFWLGGFSSGFRAAEAPILHGIGMGLTSIIAWFLVNLVVGLLFPAIDWEALTPTLAAGLLLVQMLAAVAGAWVGHRIALRGTAELGD